jgi:predicted nucleic acid-binding protein
VRFLDTNVLLYLISRDAGERKKAACANEILDRGDVALSVQVLQEFYVQATRESRAERLSHAQAVGLIESFQRFPVQETTMWVMTDALQTCDRFGISYWDASIIAAARAIGSSVVLSEDLADGMDYGGVRIENPFVDS